MILKPRPLAERLLDSRGRLVSRPSRHKQRGFIVNPFVFGSDPAAAGYLTPFYPTTLYSMRKRNSAYSGPCVRVRNRTTSVDTDIGFDSDGWCDAGALNTASGGTATLGVIIWYDQSGAAKNVVRDTSGNDPVIASAGVIKTMAGKPAIDFSDGGANNYLVCTADAAFGYGTGAFTWEVFARTASPVSAASGNNVLLNQRASRSGADPAQLYVSDNTLTTVQWYYGSGINSGVSPSANTDYHFAASYVGGASSALRVFMQGTSVINSNVTMDFGSTDNLYIGSDTSGAWRGVIGEVAITKGTCLWAANFTPRSYT